MAILASLLGILLIVPVAATVATTARSQGNLLDATNDAYIAEAGVLAVIEDLIRGADGGAPAPINYVPPVVNVGGKVPYTTVEALRNVSSLPFSSRRLLNYGKTGDPVVTVGTLSPDPLIAGPTLGAVLAAGGKTYKYPFVFDVIGAGNLPDGSSPEGTEYDANPQVVEFTFISETVAFDLAITGDVQLDLRAWEESAEVDIYAYEWDGDSAEPGLGRLPEEPSSTRLIDHSHNDETTEHAHENQGEAIFHHGSSDVTFRLSGGAIEYLNHNKLIKIKVVAKVNSNPSHIHPADAGSDSVKKDGFYHWFRKDRPNFALHVADVNFALIGAVTVDTRSMADAVVMNRGIVVSGSATDTQADDDSYLTFESVNGSIEIEVTSESFGLENLGTLAVPFIVRAHQVRSPTNNDVAVAVSVYNPDDPLAVFSGGFRKVDGYAQKITGSNLDRQMAFEVGQEAIDYINSLTTKEVKARISFSGNGKFRVELDGLMFSATSTEVQETLLAEASHRFIGPGRAPDDFWVVPPGTSYVMQLNNVQAGLLGINWAFLPMSLVTGQSHDENDQISIKVFRGTVLDDEALLPPGRYTGNPIDESSNDLVRQAHIHPNNGEAFLRTGFFQVQAGIYTIVFGNDADNQNQDAPMVYTNLFTESGGTHGTWVFGSSYRDYLIQSKFGDAVVRSVVRQAPGPATSLAGPLGTASPAHHEVSVLAWHSPVGTADEVFDKDNDYTWDEIDGGFENGEFIDESEVVSTRFTDQHLGGVTFGRVVESVGLTVNVADLASPELGVLVSVTGSGDAQATANFCETDMRLTNGDVFSVTCGPMEIAVHNGPVDIVLNSDITATIPTDGAIVVTKNLGNEVGLENIVDRETLLVSNDDGVVQILAGDDVLIEEGLGLPTPTPTPIGIPTPSPTAIPTPMPFPTATPILPATPVPTLLPTSGPTTCPRRPL